MENNYEKLFKNIVQIEPPKNLQGEILARINKKERQSAEIKSVLFGFVSVFSLGVVILTIQYSVQSFYQSGFQHYFSLIFSDSNIVLTYWKDFLSSLSGAIPFQLITILSISIFVLLWSSKFVVKNMKTLLPIS